MFKKLIGMAIAFLTWLWAMNMGFRLISTPSDLSVTLGVLTLTIVFIAVPVGVINAIREK
jgi:hypothetical protein